MTRGPVCVTVDQRVTAMLLHHSGNFAGRDIHDVIGFATAGVFAGHAQVLSQLSALFQWAIESRFLPLGRTGHGAKRHVVLVASAQAVAVHEQNPVLAELDDRWIVEEGRANAFGKCLANEEVAVPVHQKKIRATSAVLPEKPGDFLGDGTVIVVAHPELEEVAKDVECLSVSSILKKGGEGRRHLGPGGVQVKVGDEIDGHPWFRRRFRRLRQPPIR